MALPPWPQTELGVLRDLFPDGGWLAVQQVLPHRTRKAITIQASRSKIKKPLLRASKLLWPGKIIGHLTLVKKHMRVYGGRRRGMWECLCVCTRVHLVSATNLLKGDVQSCGCKRKETLSIKGKLAWAEGRIKPHTVATVDSMHRALWKIYMRGAEQRNISFELSYDEFVVLVSSPCHYCGRPPSSRMTEKSYNQYPYSGIDRKDNELWYRTHNALSCCKTCNFAKGTMLYVEFIAWLDAIATHRIARQPPSPPPPPLPQPSPLSRSLSS